MNLTWLLMFMTLPFVGHGVQTEKATKDDTAGPYINLTNFVSEPNIKAPLFDIMYYDKDAVSSGYWFMDPYYGRAATNRSGQGPCIFDNHGELVWSGGPLFENYAAFDFKTVRINGTSHLSLILAPSTVRDMESNGVGIVMDSQYRIRRKLHLRDALKFDMHEFNVVEDGRSALVVTSNALLLKSTGVWVDDIASGFQETDLLTSQPLFDWKALDHIFVNSINIPITNDRGYLIHTNSVDKNVYGDYLISSRDQNSIYKISGRDGSIIWQLGGNGSSFVHQGGFNFCCQHDARFRTENSTHTIISFLDNASDDLEDGYRTANTSSALYVALQTDVVPMTATVITKILRPDGKLSRLRGNVQELSDNKLFVCWSENGYLTEFTSSGELVLQAKFTTNALSVYRAYKFDFTGFPLEPPAFKAYISGATVETITTVFYVSWNGATEVVTWHFYGNGIDGLAFLLLGRAKKSGFETSYTAAGYQKLVYVEGIDAEGNSLGRSVVAETAVPSGWEFAVCKATECQISVAENSRPENTPDEEHSKYDNRTGATPNLKHGDEIHQSRDAVLVAAGVLVMISIFGVYQRWVTGHLMIYNEYEQVLFEEMTARQTEEW